MDNACTNVLKAANEVHLRQRVDDFQKYILSIVVVLARQKMPLKPEVFHGRDDLVESIAQLILQEDNSRVCILGPGGMGKTSVSLAVVDLPIIKERFPSGNIVWVPCSKATSATLLLETLYIQLGIPGDKKVTLDEILSQLNTKKQPRLIVLDNLEKPWHGDQNKVSIILRELDMLSHIAILVTMRGGRPACSRDIKWQLKHIESTDEEASLRIYHDIYPDSKNDPDVPRLLSALDHMPLAITLMAKLGVETRRSAKDLLNAWSESGPDMLSYNPEQSLNRSIALSVESNLVKRNPETVLLLSILSLLPAGTTPENLCWWAPSMEVSFFAVVALSQAALLDRNKLKNSTPQILFIAPVVQSYMHQQNRISQEVRKQVHLLCCEFVLAHVSRFDNPTSPDKLNALEAEDTNVQSILFGHGSPPFELDVPSHRTMEALIAFNWYRYETKLNLKIAEHVVKAARTSGVKRYIASAVWCLGLTCFQLEKYDDSNTLLLEASQLIKTLVPSDAESLRYYVNEELRLFDYHKNFYKRFKYPYV